jgi:hypothetical protein
MARGDLLEATPEELCLAAELREATEEIERLRRENEKLKRVMASFRLVIRKKEKE